MASCSGLCGVGPSIAPPLPKSSSDCCCLSRNILPGFVSPPTPRWRSLRLCVRASVVDSSESSSSDFIKRVEQAWLISQQPRPIECCSCDSKGHVECKWCGGTGFFILGDNMLCQVPSRNTTCVICAGKGSTCCSDCKGTGFRAKWLGKPSTSG